MKKLLLSLACFLLFSSCKVDSQEDSNLVVTIGPANQNVIRVALKTCEQEAKNEEEEGVSSPSVQFRNFRYQWKSTANKFEMIYVQLNFKSADLSAGKHECILAGDELVWTLNPQSANINEGDDQTYVSGCAIRCGGIKFKDTVRFSFVQGTATIYGVEVTPDGDMLPVFAETEVSMQYINKN